MMTTVNSMAMVAKHQRGLSLLSLVFWAVVISFFGIIVVRAVPAVTEYRTLLGMVNLVAKEGGGTVPEIRAAFDRNKAVQYGIESISSNDLDITKDDSGIKVSFAYDKEIEILGPVSLLIHFKGASQ